MSPSLVPWPHTAPVTHSTKCVHTSTWPLPQSCSLTSHSTRHPQYQMCAHINMSIAPVLFPDLTQHPSPTVPNVCTHQHEHCPSLVPWLHTAPVTHSTKCVHTSTWALPQSCSLTSHSTRHPQYQMCAHINMSIAPVLFPDLTQHPSPTVPNVCTHQHEHCPSLVPWPHTPPVTHSTKCVHTSTWALPQSCSLTSHNTRHPQYQMCAHINMSIAPVLFPDLTQHPSPTVPNLCTHQHEHCPSLVPWPHTAPVTHSTKCVPTSTWPLPQSCSLTSHSTRHPHYQMCAHINTSIAPVLFPNLTQHPSPTVPNVCTHQHEHCPSLVPWPHTAPVTHSTKCVHTSTWALPQSCSLTSHSTRHPHYQMCAHINMSIPPVLFPDLTQHPSPTVPNVCTHQHEHCPSLVPWPHTAPVTHSTKCVHTSTWALPQSCSLTSHSTRHPQYQMCAHINMSIAPVLFPNLTHHPSPTVPNVCTHQHEHCPSLVPWPHTAPVTHSTKCVHTSTWALPQSCSLTSHSTRHLQYQMCAHINMSIAPVLFPDLTQHPSPTVPNVCTHQHEHCPSLVP